jgi:hypothetical protein
MRICTYPLRDASNVRAVCSVPAVAAVLPCHGGSCGRVRSLAVGTWGPRESQTCCALGGTHGRVWRGDSQGGNGMILRCALAACSLMSAEPVHYIVSMPRCWILPFCNPCQVRVKSGLRPADALCLLDTLRSCSARLTLAVLRRSPQGSPLRIVCDLHGRTTTG